MHTFNFLFIKIYLKFLKILLHVSVIRPSSGSFYFLAKITLIKNTFDIPILKLAMWQHIVLCVLSFIWRAPDCACHSLCCWLKVGTELPNYTAAIYGHEMARASKYCRVAPTICVSQYGTCFISPFWRLQNSRGLLYISCNFPPPLLTFQLTTLPP